VNLPGIGKVGSREFQNDSDHDSGSYFRLHLPFELATAIGYRHRPVASELVTSYRFQVLLPQVLLPQVLLPQVLWPRTPQMLFPNTPSTLSTRPRFVRIM
jgi:hypothetical protein